MAKQHRLMPDDPMLYRLTVRHRGPISPSMMRVTVGGSDLAGFAWRGFDHWFRLFLRLPGQDRLELPALSGRRWWTQYLAMPEHLRPHCANYTVAGHRPDVGELDIDVVVHRGGSGAVEGRVAVWGCTARAGEELAILDQGLMFDRPPDASTVLVVADESGLPATAGIPGRFPATRRGR